jgi:competence ComEA-like helix-hairpin-helix protein
MTERERRIPWLTRGDRLGLGLSAGLLLLALSGNVLLRGGWGRPDVELTSRDSIRHHRIDINTAEAWQLQALNGVGPKRAEAMVRHRQRIERFQSLDELVRVRGIGPKTVERLRPYLTVHPGESVDAAQKDQ